MIQLVAHHQVITRPRVYKHEKEWVVRFYFTGSGSAVRLHFLDHPEALGVANRICAHHPVKEGTRS